MTKGRSEVAARAALNTALEEYPHFIYKPADDQRNWKPCDYMLWWYLGGPHNAWIEVKEARNKGTFPLSEIRPSQLQGMRDARRLHFPYLLVIRWKVDGVWSIVDGVGLIRWVDDQRDGDFNEVKSIDRVTLDSRWGVSSAPGQLGSLIRLALIEGL